jgi:hypothetical protein
VVDDDGRVLIVQVTKKLLDRIGPPTPGRGAGVDDTAG